MYYKVTIEAGQMRNGRNFELLRYVEANNTVELFDKLEQYPGLMSNELGYVVTMVKPISKETFLRGKEKEKEDINRLRIHSRFNINTECILKPAGRYSGFSDAIVAETTTCSVGGLGVVYDGIRLENGCRVKVDIEELHIKDKYAEITWTQGEGEKWVVGLTWLKKILSP